MQAQQTEINSTAQNAVTAEETAKEQKRLAKNEKARLRNALKNKEEKPVTAVKESSFIPQMLKVNIDWEATEKALDKGNADKESHRETLCGLIHKALQEGDETRGQVEALFKTGALLHKRRYCLTVVKTVIDNNAYKVGVAWSTMYQAYIDAQSAKKDKKSKAALRNEKKAVTEATKDGKDLQTLIAETEDKTAKIPFIKAQIRMQFQELMALDKEHAKSLVQELLALGKAEMKKAHTKNETEIAKAA